MLIVRLPFPDKKLMPNRKHGKAWISTYASKTRQKEEAFLLTKKALHEAGPQEWSETIPLSLLFLTPDRRRRDCDNMHSAAKSALDGMAQALGVDDSRFKPVLIDWVLGPKEGALIAAIGVQIQSGMNL